MPFVFFSFLFEVVLLFSYGSVQEKQQVILFCDGALHMSKGSLRVLLLVLGLVVQFLQFVLEAEVFLAEMQHFLVILSLQGGKLMLIGLNDPFQLFNVNVMVSLPALSFLLILILVLLHVGPQLVDLVVQVLKLLARLNLHILQHFFLFVYLLGVLPEFFLFHLDALLKLKVLIIEALHNVFVAAEFLEGFLHAQHDLRSQFLRLQVQLLHLFALLEVLLVEISVAGQFFDALLLGNRQYFIRIEMAMDLLQLSGQPMAVLALPLKFQPFLEQRSLELTFFPPFLRTQFTDTLHQFLHLALMPLHLLLMQLLQPPHTFLHLCHLPLALSTFSPLLIQFELKVGQLHGVLLLGRPDAGPKGVYFIVFEGEDEEGLLEVSWWLIHDIIWLT